MENPENVHSKEYAVEIYRDGKFSEQLNVYGEADYNKATALAKAQCKNLAANEEAHITEILYDEDGEEIGLGCTATYTKG